MKAALNRPSFFYFCEDNSVKNDAKSKRIPFYKYHGLGNDFAVFRGRDLEAGQAGQGVDFRALAQSLCERHRGIGADGLLIIWLPEDGGEYAELAANSARMRIYNRDGSRPEMCGNGVRCVVRYLVENKGFSAGALQVISDAGPRACRVTERTDSGVWQVEVDMGEAKIAPENIDLNEANRAFSLVGVNMGNPHAVAFEMDVEDVELLERLGRKLNAAHPDFLGGVNLEFVEQIGPQHLRTSVFERGVGRTQACGTGACAVAVAAVHAGRCDPAQPVEVELPGGALSIKLDDGRVWMTGPVEAVFEGRI